MFSVAPQVEVVLISADNTSQVKEGMSIQLDCRVSANPSATAVRWMQNVRTS